MTRAGDGRLVSTSDSPQDMDRILKIDEDKSPQVDNINLMELDSGLKGIAMQSKIKTIIVIL